MGWADLSRAGPRNGATRKELVEYARSLAGKRSAFVPDPTDRTELPNVPPRKRHTRKEPKLFEKPAPRVKNMDSGKDIRYT